MEESERFFRAQLRNLLQIYTELVRELISTTLRAAHLIASWARALIWLAWGDDRAIRSLALDRVERADAVNYDPPTYPTALFGWRMWIFDYRERALKPVSHLFPRSAETWAASSQPARAICHVRPQHSPPVPSCSCGLHAYHLESLPTGDPPHRGVVWGLVAARGRAQLHAKGFRAEEIQILALRDPGAWGDAASGSELRAALKEYGVPILRSQKEMLALARRYQPECELTDGLDGWRQEKPVETSGRLRWIAPALGRLAWVTLSGALRAWPAIIPISAMTGIRLAPAVSVIAILSGMLWIYTIALALTGRDHPRWIGDPYAPRTPRPVS